MPKTPDKDEVPQYLEGAEKERIANKWWNDDKDERMWSEVEADEYKKRKAAKKQEDEQREQQAAENEGFENQLADVIELKTYGYRFNEGSPKFKFVQASEIEEMQIDWAIDQWLASGMVHLLAGQAGRGKTGIALAIASMITRKAIFPTGAVCKQGKVIIWSGEDSLNYTIVPRLRANGADMKKVLFIAADTHGEFDPATHIPQLDEMIVDMGEDHGIVMLIMDPITRIATKVRNSNDSIQIRDALENLRQFAERTNIAVLGVTHFLKRHNAIGSDVLDRVIGSQAWAAVARTVWAVDYVKELQKDVLARVKSNIGMHTDDIEYSIVGAEYDQRIQKVKFGETIPNGRELMENQSIDAPPQDTVEKESAKDSAKKLILQALSQAERHMMSWDEILEMIGDNASKATMRRARDALSSSGMVASSNEDGKYYWHLTTKAVRELDNEESID